MDRYSLFNYILGEVVTNAATECGRERLKDVFPHSQNVTSVDFCCCLLFLN